ncbi:FAD-dependent oxidoreductase [Nonomuraea longispora]|uniref:FAD-dependent oxidoreductase n=1 Tax=Nonomuraea longispora TaxID=1848320 RepID=A0A4R4MLH0_9ACTN|nr:FAD-dependent oxidoreductase [Nonomuraea longispora]TDB96734.1 FAD-dependent oxidoreductase [Nonomuraea longispora]
MTFDVIVVGAGAAGVAAALAAASNGARTALVEASPYPGGELVGGLPLLGTRNSLGERIVGGPLDSLLDSCASLDGYVGDLFDWRTTWGTCVDPEAMRIAVVEQLAVRSVTFLPSSLVIAVETADGGPAAVSVLDRAGTRSTLTAHVVVDASGDGSVSELAGARLERGDVHGGFQPVSLTFRMGGVDFGPLLQFVRDNPEQFMLGQNPVIGKTPAECAERVHASGLPFVAMSAEDPGSLMGTAIEQGSLYPTTGMWMWPTSLARRELGLNTTRVSGIDAMDARAMGEALATLTGQVRAAIGFVRKHLPGFAGAHLAGAGPKVGIRETRRVAGEHTLSGADALRGRKHADGVAKGGHHVDIHGSGTYQKRVPIEGGRSYDIPYAALVPRHVRNLLVCGRALSSDREANGSARVIGTCMATGQAAGTAAALAARAGLGDVREVPVGEVRDVIRAQGGVVDGTA